MIRRDGSIRSANTPNRFSVDDIEVDYGVYRCMVISVNFTDDEDKNFTFDNKQVSYDCLIIGGKLEGQTIANAKMVNQFGGQYNYHERILRKAERPFTGPGSLPVEEQKGDIVYVQFVGKTSNPIIIGLGTHVLDQDTTGATKEDGQIHKEEYNGVYSKINKMGEYEFIRKGGELVTKGDSSYFVPADRTDDEEGLETPEELFQARLKFFDNIMLWEDPSSSIEFKKIEKLWTHVVGKDDTLPKYVETIDGENEKVTKSLTDQIINEEEGKLQKTTRTYKDNLLIIEDGKEKKTSKTYTDKLSIVEDGENQNTTKTYNGKLTINEDGLNQNTTKTYDGKLTIVEDGLNQSTTKTYDGKLTVVEDGLNEKTTRTYNSGLEVLEDGTADEYKVTANAGAKLKISQGKVGLGTSTAELVTELSKTLQILIDHLAELQTETHIGNLGYPTGVPVNAANYAATATALTATKALIDSIKGGV